MSASDGIDLRHYKAWLSTREASGDPVTLEEFRHWVKVDDNLPWRLDSGTIVNLLEEAIDALDDLSP